MPSSPLKYSPGYLLHMYTIRVAMVCAMCIDFPNLEYDEIVSTISCKNQHHSFKNNHGYIVCMHRTGFILKQDDLMQLSLHSPTSMICTNSLNVLFFLSNLLYST